MPVGSVCSTVVGGGTPLNVGGVVSTTVTIVVAVALLPAPSRAVNVTVVGPSRVISEPAEVAALDALGARAWAPAEVPCYVAVRIALVRGRRLVAAPAAAPLDRA